MIRIALAAALGAVVIGDAVTVPAQTGAVARSEQPSAARNDRVAANMAAPGCDDAAWPYYPARCVGGRGPVRIISGNPAAGKRT